MKVHRQDLRRILVFRIGHLGDTLVALPAFSALRRAFPEAHLSLLTNTDPMNPHYVGAASVLPAKGLFDEVITYPASRSKATPAFLKLLLRLRRGRFDAVVYLMTRSRLPDQIERDILFFRLAGIPKSFGIGHLLGNYLDFGIERPLPKVEAEYQFLLDCLRSEGLIDSDSTIPEDLRIFTDTDLEVADRWLAQNCGEAYKSENLIAVAPGSKWASKVWHESRFRAVVSELIARADVFPVIFGGAEDAEKGDRLISQWGTGANAAGELSVKEAAGALSRCRLYLGNDTGTMHLAASSGTRCVAVFAAVDFEGRWNPAGAGHTVFRQAVPCEGCSSPNCANNRLCLDMISEASVLEACLAVLTGPESGTGVEAPAQ